MLDAQKGAFDIDPLDPVEIFLGGLGDRLDEKGAGIVDQAMRNAEARFGLGEDTLPLVFMADIVGNEDGFAAGLGDEAQSFFTALAVAAGGDDMGAFAGERDTGGLTDSLGGACDDDGAAAEIGAHWAIHPRRSQVRCR